MKRREEVNNILKNGEEIIKDCRIAGGEIFLTMERIITNRLSLRKKISLSSKTSFSSIPLTDIVSYRIASGMPFFSLPRLIVTYKDRERKREVFFEFTNKEELKDFYQGFCNAFDKKLSTDVFSTTGYGIIIN